MSGGPRMRSILIEMAHRRQRPGTGSRVQLLTRKAYRMQFPDLTPILHPIQWAVAGAAAIRMYMAERTTQDLDIVVQAADATEIRRKLAEASFRYEGDLTIPGSSWTTPEGFSIDVLELAEPWSAQAIAEAQHNRDAQGLPVVPLPYLVLMKFQASRVQDLADITRMLAQAGEDMLAAVRQLFASLLPDEMADLESLITLGRLEMAKGAEGH